MISRSVVTKNFVALVSAAILLPAAAWAEGPSYTYVGVNYEWTDSKFGIDPSTDPNFNNGSIEGVGVDGSLGVLNWLHIAGEYFTGDCVDCDGADDGSASDVDFDGYRVGVGLNKGLGFIGLSDNTDIILRGYYVDVDLTGIVGDGWAGEVELRSQFSDRTEFQVGYAYQDVGDVQNRDLYVALLYRVWGGVALSGGGKVADDDVGFNIGIRWYFGDLIFGDRDSIVR